MTVHCWVCFGGMTSIWIIAFRSVCALPLRFLVVEVEKEWNKEEDNGDVLKVFSCTGSCRWWISLLVALDDQQTATGELFWDDGESINITQ